MRRPNASWSAPQRRRYEALSDLGDLHRRRVLDVGCGRGDFLEFLLAKGVRPLYCGLTFSRESLSHCRARFHARADVTCHFEAGSIFGHNPSAPYDFVVASGVFSEAPPGPLGPSLERMFAWCQDGLAANFPCRPAPRAGAGSYADPARALDLALSLTPMVRMRHDYLPDDFTLYLYRAARPKRSIRGGVA